MTRIRIVLGLISGAVMVLSSAAHSILGWNAVRGELVAAHVPPDLLRGLGLGWQLGGASMLAFGCIVLTIFVGRLRGREVAAWPAAVIAVVYVAFGAAAFVASRYETFFVLVFVVPGLLLAAASIAPPRRDLSGR